MSHIELYELFYQFKRPVFAGFDSIGNLLENVIPAGH